MIASLVLSGRGQGTGGFHLPPSTSRLSPAPGFALVATLLMITVITGAAVAFFQSTRIERFVARNYADLARAQLAAEGAAAEAQARIAAAVGTSFQYISGQDAQASNSYIWGFTLGANGQPVLNPSGPVRLVSTNTNPSSAISNTIVIDSAAGLQRSVAAVTITNATDTNRSIRYAFWVDDAASSLNPIRSGTNNRLPGLGPGSLGLPYRTGSGNSFSVLPGASLTAWPSNVSYTYVTNTNSGQTYASLRWPLITPRTMNLITNPSPNTPFQDYDLAADSFADAATPTGTPKVNLRVLAAYANTLSQNQGVSNAKAQLLENLLTNPSSAWQTNIQVVTASGSTNRMSLGGNFSFLLNRYNSNDCRQILANLVDYLDADRIPTTDNADNPTYFGVECWPAGTPTNTYGAGHPLVSYVCTGLVFNWSGAAGRQGGLNSTRVLAGVGLVNPWPEPVIFNWGTRYRWVVNFSVTGNVTPVPPGFTSNAQSFFLTNLTANLNIGTNNLPTGGTLFPAAITTSTNFNNNNNLVGSAISQLLTFQNLQVRPTLLRLEYSTNSGVGWSTIANLDACLSNLPTTLPNVTSPGNSGSTVAIFNRPGFSSIQDWHLRSDPRTGFSTNAWRLTGSTANANIPTPTDTLSAISATNAFSDPLQGLPSDATWFRSSAMTNHFNGHFGKATTNQSTNTMTYSIGELGFLSTGQAWKTLNLVDTNPPAAEQEDWRILDYVTSGEMPEEAAKASFLTNTLNTPRGRFVRGPINANSRKYGTWLGWLTGAAPNAAIAAAATEISALGTNAISSSVGSLFTNSWVNQFGTGTNQMLRENAVRAVADGLTVSSRTFIVYSVGESLFNGRVMGRAALRTLILVDTDPTTGQARLSKIYQSSQ
jgi:Tfp pilus assembly protein PilX